MFVKWNDACCLGEVLVLPVVMVVMIMMMLLMMMESFDCN